MSDQIYRAGEVRRATGASRSRLRYWERLGHIQPSKNCALGWRAYSQADMDAVRRALVLMEKGLRLSAAFAQVGRLAEFEQNTGRILMPHLMTAPRGKPVPPSQT